MARHLNSLAGKEAPGARHEAEQLPSEGRDRVKEPADDVVAAGGLPPTEHDPHRARRPPCGLRPLLKLQQGLPVRPRKRPGDERGIPAGPLLKAGPEPGPRLGENPVPPERPWPGIWDQQLH